MTGNCFFTRTDLTSAYNQLRVTPESALAQAIITPFGLYHVNVLNFGVASVSSIFQNFISELLAEFGGKIAVLDDLWLGAPTLPELIELEKRVFAKISALGLKLNLKK